MLTCEFAFVIANELVSAIPIAEASRINFTGRPFPSERVDFVI